MSDLVFVLFLLVFFCAQEPHETGCHRRIWRGGWARVSVYVYINFEESEWLLSFLLSLKSRFRRGEAAVHAGRTSDGLYGNK